MPLSYNYPKSFIISLSPVIYHKKIYTGKHIITKNNLPCMPQLTCTSLYCIGHNIMRCHYFTVTLNCLYLSLSCFFHTKIFYFTIILKFSICFISLSQKIILAHVVSKWIINATYVDEFSTLHYCIITVLMVLLLYNNSEFFFFPFPVILNKTSILVHIQSNLFLDGQLIISLA